MNLFTGKSMIQLPPVPPSREASFVFAGRGPLRRMQIEALIQRSHLMPGSGLAPNGSKNACAAG